MLINRLLLRSRKIIELSILFSLLTLLSPSALEAEPWGKDADLVSGSPSICIPSSRIECVKRERSLFLVIGEEMIRFHQEVISPADGPRSHFIPSSSQYTLEAMRRYGFFRGYMMGCDRLMRENNDPWVYKKVVGPAGLMKWNPVP